MNYSFIKAACMGLAISQASMAGEWQSIFNGKDLSGWTPKIRFEAAGEDKDHTFRVKDGKMVVSYENYDKFDNRFGHIFYKEKLSHYRLRLDYRFVGDQANGGEGWAYRNSGVMVHSPPTNKMALDQSFPVSVEIQLLGGNGKDDRPTANVCSPGTNYVWKGDLITEHCVNSSSKTFHGDQWVHLEIEVRGDRLISHKINDEIVFSYTKPSLDPSDPDAKLLIKDGAPIALSSGYFSLQSESHPIEFKNIQLMQLKE